MLRVNIIIKPFLLSLLLLLFLLVQVLSTNYSWGFEEALHRYPESIKFSVYVDEIPKKLERKLYVWADKDSTGIEAQFTELSSEDTRAIIPRSVLHLEPSEFHLQTGETKQVEVTVVANISDHYVPGIYKGRVNFMSENLTSPETTIQIQILERSLVINPNSIKFVFDEDDVRADFREVEIGAEVPISSITGVFSPLWTEDGSGTRMDYYRLNLEPPTLDLDPKNGSSAIIKFEPSKDLYAPGTYKGSLMFSSETLKTTIPITVVINPVQVLDDILKPVPDSIKFLFDEGHIKPDFREVDIIAKAPVSDVVGEFKDLESDDGSGKKISGSMFSMENATFSVIRGQVPSLKIKFSPLDGDSIVPGTYKGSLVLSSGKIRTPIPIAVTINPVEAKLGSSIWPIFFVLLGMGAAIIVALVKEGSEVGKRVLQSAEKAVASMSNSVSQKHRSKAEFEQGRLHFREGVIRFVLENDDTTAIKEFELAQSNFERMNENGVQVLPAIPSEMEALRLKIKHSINLRLLTRKDLSWYLVIGVIFIIATLTLLQGISKEILDFSEVLPDAFPDAIQSILYGFGAQAIADMIVPYFKK